MCDISFIARTSDGLLLAESWAPHSANDQFSQKIKYQVKSLLQRLQNSASHGAVDAGPFRFYYLLGDGLSYLTVCNARYPRRLAFAYLEEVKTLFEEELKTAFGSCSVDYISMVETIETPYYFIKFDRILQKKRLEFEDTGSSKALAKLNDSLAEVSEIMKQNIDDILNRGEHLGDVGRKASDLKFASEKFKGLAKKLSFRALIQQYAPLALVALFLLILLFWKLYL